MIRPLTRAALEAAHHLVAAPLLEMLREGRKPAQIGYGFFRTIAEQQLRDGKTPEDILEGIDQAEERLPAAPDTSFQARVVALARQAACDAIDGKPWRDFSAATAEGE